MPKNIFKTLPTKTHQKLKKKVYDRVGKKLAQYTQSKNYTFDVIANRTNQQGRKIAMAEVNSMSLEAVATLDPRLADPKRVRNQFKAFVKSDTRVISHRYDWHVIQRMAGKA